jgi:hypothetical protein
MKEYRIYTIGVTGKVIDVKPTVCASDLDALDEAKAMLNGICTFEVWQLARKVAVLGTTGEGPFLIADSDDVP